MSTLYNEKPLVVNTELAIVVGLHKSMIIQQIHYWVTKKTNIRDGKSWVYNSYKAWQEQFPFWDEKTIKNLITSLEKEGLVISGNYNKAGFDRTKWYTLSYEKLSELTEKRPLDEENFSQCTGQEIPNATGKDFPTNTIDYHRLTPETNKSLAGPRPAVKRAKSPEQIAKETEINNQLTGILEFCKSENYPINPDRKFTGIMIGVLRREGPDRIKKAIRNYLADIKENGKYAGSFETLFYNPGRMAKYANMQEEKKLVKTWKY